MRYCPKCGSEIDEGIVFCPTCGADCSPNTNNSGSGTTGASFASSGNQTSTICPKCGGSNISFQRESSGVQGYHKTTALCKSCGNTWTTANDLTNRNLSNSSSSKSKSVALILCIFLGYFGVHHFYVGKVGMGILYFFTAGLCGIGWIIDIIRILAGSFKDSQGNVLQ